MNFIALPQYHSKNKVTLGHAWLNLSDKHMTTDTWGHCNGWRHILSILGCRMARTGGIGAAQLVDDADTLGGELLLERLLPRPP